MDDEHEDTQWTDAARQRLRAASDSLTVAIGSHVGALSALTGKRHDLPVVFEANDALIAALRSYNDAIFDLTGTSAVPLYDDDDDEGEEPLAPADILRLSVEARFDFIVRDEERFTSYVRERYVSADMDKEQVELHVGDPTGCLSELFQMDCWDASAYTALGLEPAGEGWRVGDIPKALFEMTFDERDECGF